MGRNPTQNEGFKKVISYFVGQEEVELSLSPTVVMPLLTAQDKPYNVRVLMDSGSMTNWLAKDLLDKLNHTVKGHTSLEVYTLTGSTIKKFKLVEIYYYYNGQKHNYAGELHVLLLILPRCHGYDVAAPSNADPFCTGCLV